MMPREADTVIRAPDQSRKPARRDSKAGRQDQFWPPARRLTRTSLMAQGEAWLWLSGGALALALIMILAFIAIVLWNGAKTFWPGPVVLLETVQGENYMGELVRSESYEPYQASLEEPDEIDKEDSPFSSEKLVSERRLIRTGNFDLLGSHFHWVNDQHIKPGSEQLPDWALVVERLSWGRFYGIPNAFLIDQKIIAQGPEDSWNQFQRHHYKVRAMWSERRQLESKEIGLINHKMEKARLSLRRAELEMHAPTAWTAAYYHLLDAKNGGQPADIKAAQDKLTSLEQQGVLPAAEFLQATAEYESILKQSQQDFADLSTRIARINQEIARYQLRFLTAQGQETSLGLDEIVRAYPANQLGWLDKIGIYLSRWWEFLTSNPREANSEGGVFPALFGTVAMTLIMSFAVLPFGVLAALYLREYARRGPLISSIRIAINNLAGVPSIVFGVFGLGFFCYIIGGSIDQVFFPEKLPNPTYGTGGLLWASLTLALLTLPVVIVATEEALAAVPSSMREGSYACGASKWQTIRRIVLPRAMPGIMTGMILAMARGAGEVAPLMLVGAVKLAPELPIDSIFPFIHAERSFMHLGFHIFDLGFQSQNSEAAKPMVFTTTLLLVGLISFLNITAITLRSRLRKSFMTSQF